MFKNRNSGTNKLPWFKGPTLPLLGCVNLGELLDFSVPWCPHLENGLIVAIPQRGASGCAQNPGHVLMTCREADKDQGGDRLPTGAWRFHCQDPSTDPTAPRALVLGP